MAFKSESSSDCNARARHHCRETGPFGDRDAAHVQVMNQSPKSNETRIALEIKTRQDHLKGNLAAHVGKLAPSKSNPRARFGQSLARFSHRNLASGSTNRLMQPCRGDSINPQMLPRGPGSASIVFGVELCEGSLNRAGLIGREAYVDGRLSIGHRSLHCLRDSPGKKSRATMEATSRAALVRIWRASSSSNLGAVFFSAFRL